MAVRASAIFGVEARGGGGECAVMAATELIAPVAEYFLGGQESKPCCKTLDAVNPSWKTMLAISLPP